MRWLLILIFSGCFSLFGQITMDRGVPEIVQKNFSRKFPGAENVSWDKVDSNFKADCFYRDRGTYAEYTPEGEWVMTITDLDLKTLYRPIENYLDENFKGDKVLFAEEADKADRQNYYYVQVEHKNKETKETYDVELFFDKTGRIEQVKLPDGVNDMTIVGIDDPHADIPSEVIDSWQKRFPRAEDIEWTTVQNPKDALDKTFIASFKYRDQKTQAWFKPDGTWIETHVSYDEKELHRMVQAYLEEHHKDDDFIRAEKVTKADRTDYTYVKMERMERGQSKPYVFELFFDKAGQIQKVNRPQVLKNQYLLTVDIPNYIARKFKSRFAAAKDVTWETSDTNYVARFTYRDQKTTATFSDSADWIQTVSVLDLKDIYRPVQRQLDENYKDYKLTYAEKVTRADRKNYYYIEMVSKKRDLEPQKLGLFFDSTGRPKEEKEVKSN